MPKVLISDSMDSIAEKILSLNNIEVENNHVLDTRSGRSVKKNVV